VLASKAQGEQMQLKEQELKIKKQAYLSRLRRAGLSAPDAEAAGVQQDGKNESMLDDE